MAIDPDVRPTNPGSPFRTGNFNKFALGIMLGALILAILVLIYFLGGVRKHQPGPAAPEQHSALHAPAGLRT